MNHHCDYVVIKQDQYGIMEVCRECKKRLFTKKGKDHRVDNQQYIKEHIRNTAQPGGKTAKIFERYYGDPKVRITPDKLKKHE